MNFIDRLVGINRSPFRRRNATGRGTVAGFRDPIIIAEGEDGARVVQYDDNSTGGMAARFNANQIYGPNNVPDNFARRTVIEVPDGNGGFTPVNQANPGAPVGEQIIALDHFRNTGSIFGAGQGVEGLIQGVGNGATDGARPQLPGAGTLSPAQNRPGVQAGANPTGTGLNLSQRPVSRPVEFITGGDSNSTVQGGQRRDFL